MFCVIYSSIQKFTIIMIIKTIIFNMIIDKYLDNWFILIITQLYLYTYICTIDTVINVWLCTVHGSWHFMYTYVRYQLILIHQQVFRYQWLPWLRINPQGVKSNICFRRWWKWNSQNTVWIIILYNNTHIL